MLDEYVFPIHAGSPWRFHVALAVVLALKSFYEDTTGASTQIQDTGHTDLDR